MSGVLHGMFLAGAKGEVVYDSVGNGTNLAAATTFTHNASAGTFVILAIGSYDAFSSAPSASYGGQAMTYIGKGGGYGENLLYYLTNAPGGSQTVSVAASGKQAVANTIAFKGVSSFTSVAFDNNSPVSKTCATGEMIVGALSVPVGLSPHNSTSFTGGTNRYYAATYFDNFTYYGGLALSHSSTSTTFAWTSSWPPTLGTLLLKP